MDNFGKERQEFYNQIDGFWHDLYNTEYALWDIKLESKQNIQRIRHATERIGQILFKTANLLRILDHQTLLQLGFPKETLSFLRLQTLPIETVIARMDLVVTEKDIKLLEFNSDTPTFIKETFFVNGELCKAFGVRNPNEGYELKLQQAIRRAINDAARQLNKNFEELNIVFTSHGDNDEDRFTTLYLQELYGGKSQYLNLNQLRLYDEPLIVNNEVVFAPGLYDDQNNKIDILYRQTYPIEHLVHDEDPQTNEKVGQILMNLVSEGELAIINPPSAFLLQSKAVMALIWGLYEENHSFYTQQELSWVKEYFLPTYLDEDVFISKAKAFVKKPSFGREGDTIEVYDGDGVKLDANSHQTYLDALPVFQEFIELPKTIIQTESGEKVAHYMYGSFYISGEASAIGIRAGAQITNNESYFLPIGFLKEED